MLATAVLARRVVAPEVSVHPPMRVVSLALEEHLRLPRLKLARGPGLAGLPPARLSEQDSSLQLMVSLALCHISTPKHRLETCFAVRLML